MSDKNKFNYIKCINIYWEIITYYFNREYIKYFVPYSLYLENYLVLYATVKIKYKNFFKFENLNKRINKFFIVMNL